MPRKPHSKPVLSPGLIKIRTTDGLQSKLARHLGVTRQAISDWPAVPIDRIPEVEQFTGIDREELRPEIFKRPNRRKKRASHTSI